MLKIEHLTKRFGEKTAVDDLSLEINAGEIHAFIGRNGAGKTTTIKSCCGILPFDSGEITIDGRSVASDPVACKKMIAYLPDNPDLYEYMKGGEYINFVADIFGVDKTRRTKLMERYAEELEIADSLGTAIGSYSHGMKQKVAIIAALIHEPKLFLMDEPFVGLDPKASFVLKGYLREMCDNGGAIFYSTHVLDVAEKICDRVSIIRNGKLVRSGSMDEVKGDESLEEVFLELEG